MVSLRALGLPLPIAVTSSLANTRGKGKIDLYMCAWWPVVSNRVLDFCLE